MPTLDMPVISIYNRDGVFLDWLRAPVSVRVTPRWLEVGDAELVVQPTDYRVALLREPGARVQIALRGEHVLGGPVTRWSVKGPGDPQWSFTVTDDAAILDRILCVPDPAKPLDQQPAGPKVWTGKLESVVKALAGQNAPLLGAPVDVVADAGRGPNVALSARWQPVSDVIAPAMRAAGLGVSVVWQPTTKRVLLDVVEQRTYPVQLSVESRTVTEYDVSSTAPVATRVYLGPQDGTVFTTQVNPNTDVESLYGPYLRGATFESASSVDEKSTAASAALNDGGPKSGMSVSLSETPYVRYGGENGLHVGDRATIRIGGVEVEDVVREAVIEWKAGDGLTVKPAVGGWDNSPVFALTDAVRRLGATLRRYTR